MKRIFTVIFMLLVTGMAYAQEIIMIHGSQFHVELDNYNMTAKITDYEHVIDDAEWPITVNSRKLKRIAKGKRILDIPAKVEVNGKEYLLTGIGRAAFADYKNFDYVAIPNTVTSIEEYAFFRTNLIEVRIPVSVTNIGDRAFGWCKKLKHITLENKQVNFGADVHTESAVRVKIDEVPNAAWERQTAQRQVNTPVQGIPAVPQAAVVKSPSDVDTNLPAASDKAEKTFAIIIANENYVNDVPVDYALQDGRIFRDYCETVLGLPKENIRFQENATLNGIRGMVNWISNVAKVYKGQSKIIFYYAGHGVPDETGATNVLPVDGSGKDPKTGYSLKELYTTLGSLKAQSICVFLDACFSGKQRNDDLLVAARGVRRAKEEMPLGNMIVLSAAKEDETAHSYPDKGHGLFTYFLLKKLKETKGDVTLGELAAYVEENVSQKAIVVLNMMQTPTTSVSAPMKNTWRTMKLR